MTKAFFQVTHDLDIFSDSKNMLLMISKCKLWWKVGVERGKLLPDRKISDIGRCLSKLVSKVTILLH